MPVEDAGSPCFSTFPSQIDFGEIEANTTALTRVRLTNLSDRALQPRPAPLAPPFSFDGATFEQLAPGASALITVRFAPTDGLLHFARLEVSAAGDCSAVVPLRGLGKGGFSVLPTELRFGALDPGASRSLELTLSNTQRSPVVLDRLTLTQPGGDTHPFSVDASVPLSIPPQSALTLTVTASPPGFDFYQGFLALAGPATSHQVGLQVIGGVPVGRVEPEEIHVDKMDFTPGSNPPSFVDRVVRVSNVADAGSPFSGLDMVPPFFTALRPDGGVSLDLLITFFGTISAGQSQDTFVHVSPPGLGVHQYQLVLFTNSPLTPELTVDFTVNALSLPPCRLEHPESVVFTALPGAGSEGSVRFSNDSGVSCLLDNVRVGTPDFSITDGGVLQLELPPGAVHEVSLAGPDAGSLRRSLLFFHVLGPSSTEESIDLRAPP